MSKTAREGAIVPAAKKTTTQKPAKKAAKRSAKKAAGRSSFRRRICNVVPSTDTENDFDYSSSVASGAVRARVSLPAGVDLRAPWWKINDQENTGSCVGWATADGVVRWHMVKAGKLAKDKLLSPRHVWMASKETDRLTTHPETFLEEAGTMIKAAVKVARRSGVALESDLPFHISTTMYTGSEDTFYARCAKHRIATYHNLRHDLDAWKHWLAESGPILVALLVDSSWDNAALNGGEIDTFKPSTVRGGHAVAVVGYRADGRFIVRNSWGTSWGDRGFGYVSPEYVQASFFPESYGVTI
jgi:C1A family cysteine protease